MTPELLDKLDRCPPFLAYYTAFMFLPEQPSMILLAERSGLPLRTFARNVRKESWSGVRVDVMVRIASACGVDLLNPEPVIEKFLKAYESGRLFEDFQGGNKRNARGRMTDNLNRIAGRYLLDK